MELRPEITLELVWRMWRLEIARKGSRVGQELDLGGKSREMEKVRLNVSHANLTTSVVEHDGVALTVSSQKSYPHTGLNKTKELPLKDISNKLEANL